MTLATIFQSFLGSSSTGRDHSTAPQSHGYFSEKNSGAAEYYHYGSHKRFKGKSKSDKKHAVLSALTLLAFLFFLNILQNCIREQSQNRGTTMMFLPTAPTGQQGKEPDSGQLSQHTENQFGEKRSPEQDEQREKRSLSKVTGRKTRTLLGISVSEDSLSNTRRKVKFIQNLNNFNNWTRELSEVSDKDLEGQKLKTMNFPLYWKNNRPSSAETMPSSVVLSKETLVPRVSVFKIEQSFPVLKRITKRERTTSTLRAVPGEKETVGTSPFNVTVQKKFRDHKNPVGRKPEGFQRNKYIFSEVGYKRSQSSPPDSRWKGFDQTPIRKQNNTRPMQEATTPGAPLTPKNTAAAHNVLSAPGHVTTTPRNKRSDYLSSVRPADFYEYDGLNDQTREHVQLPPTPAVGLDLNTFQTFPVYNYYNHRPNADFYRENVTANTVSSESAAVTEVDQMRTELSKPTTETPLSDPAKMFASNLKLPLFKFRNKYHDHYDRYPTRNHYSTEHRYRYSPYRKAGTHEGTHFHDPLHDDYHVVLAKYPANKEPGFDLFNFFWTVFASFAKPLTKLVPSFAKEDDREPHCFDLLVCEAQRVSRFMGPTAEALTATLGTLLTWAVTEETRQSVVDALSAGRENTCQQQIRDCEGRSGGKSAVTVIAQLLEMKLRGLLRPQCGEVKN